MTLHPDQDPHILFAYGFDGQGGGYALVGAEIAKLIHDDRLAWVHLDANHPDTRSWLKREVAYLDTYILDALLADETRPRMTQVGDGLLLIVKGVNLNPEADPEDMVSIRLWVDRHRVISLQKRSLKAVRDLEDKLQQGKGPDSAGAFVAMLIARLFERMQPVLLSLDESINDIEELVLDGRNSQLKGTIVELRRKTIVFRRHLVPQRDAIRELMDADTSWLDEEHKRHLQESHNHIARYLEDLEAIWERAHIVKDELSSSIADRLNRNMYVLSVIAAIFLPLGFLTGLLGINVGGIPGTHNAYAFLLVCGVLGLIVALQIIIFKKFRWF